MSPSLELHPLVLALRPSARARENGSPWLPVQITTTRPGSRSVDLRDVDHVAVVDAAGSRVGAPPPRSSASTGRGRPRPARSRERRVHDLLHPVDVAREAGGHHDLRARSRRCRRSTGPTRPLARRCTRPPRRSSNPTSSRCTPVPLASSARPCRSVGRPSSGRLVDLEVAGVQDRAVAACRSPRPSRRGSSASRGGTAS